MTLTPDYSGETEPDFTIEIPAQTVSVISIADEDEEKEVPVCLVFDEKVAEDLCSYLCDRYDVPGGTVLRVKLLSVHPDQLEEWIRE